MEAKDNERTALDDLRPECLDPPDTVPETAGEMREALVPWPATARELAEYIEQLVERPHTPETRIQALSMAAVAAFNYVVIRLGVTGHQSAHVDLDIVRRLRDARHGLLIVDGDDLFHQGQEFLLADVKKFLDKQRAELREEARDLLKNNPNAQPETVARWRRLAEDNPS